MLTCALDCRLTCALLPTFTTCRLTCAPDNWVHCIVCWGIIVIAAWHWIHLLPAFPFFFFSPICNFSNTCQSWSSSYLVYCILRCDIFCLFNPSFSEALPLTRAARPAARQLGRTSFSSRCYRFSSRIA